nr:SDR family oxidoreductase [Paenibacillus phyllosphaerae]
MLKGKNAVVYGAGGHIGGAVARAFAREGANVFLAGRTIEKLELVAEHIRAEGGTAQFAQLDALDHEMIESHLESVVRQVGTVDISFNATWIRGDLQGTPLLEISCEHFTLPVLTGVQTHFLTSTAAARHMARQRSGVILTLSASSSVLSGRDRRFHRTGGFSTACTAIEGLTYSLAGELGPLGIRVACLRSDAIPETWSSDASEIKTYMEDGTALGRLPTLNELANAAVLAASDRASAITGTVLNVTCGSIMN